MSLKSKAYYEHERDLAVHMKLAAREAGDVFKEGFYHGQETIYNYILRTFDPVCNHPQDLAHPIVCFASQKSYDNLIKAGIESVLSAQLKLDSKITDSFVHFPQMDGTCQKYSV